MHNVDIDNIAIEDRSATMIDLERNYNYYYFLLGLMGSFIFFISTNLLLVQSWYGILPFAVCYLLTVVGLCLFPTIYKKFFDYREYYTERHKPGYFIFCRVMPLAIGLLGLGATYLILIYGLNIIPPSSAIIGRSMKIIGALVAAVAVLYILTTVLSFLVRLAVWIFNMIMIKCETTRIKNGCEEISFNSKRMCEKISFNSKRMTILHYSIGFILVFPLALFTYLKVLGMDFVDLPNIFNQISGGLTYDVALFLIISIIPIVLCSACCLHNFCSASCPEVKRTASLNELTCNNSTSAPGGEGGNYAAPPEEKQIITPYSLVT